MVVSIYVVWSWFRETRVLCLRNENFGMGFIHKHWFQKYPHTTIDIAVWYMFLLLHLNSYMKIVLISLNQYTSLIRVCTACGTKHLIKFRSKLLRNKNELFKVRISLYFSEDSIFAWFSEHSSMLCKAVYS